MVGETIPPPPSLYIHTHTYMLTVYNDCVKSGPLWLGWQSGVRNPGYRYGTPRPDGGRHQPQRRAAPHSLWLAPAPYSRKEDRFTLHGHPGAENKSNASITHRQL